MKKVIEKLELPTEYKKREDAKASIISLGVICIFLLIFASISVSFNLKLLANTVILGAIAYELALLMALRAYTHISIKKIKKEKVKKSAKIIAEVLFGILILTTFFMLLTSMSIPSRGAENKYISLLVGLALIIIPTILWPKIFKFSKLKISKKITFLFLLFFFIFTLTPSFAQNESTNQTQNETQKIEIPELSSLTNALSILQKGMGYFSYIVNFYENLKSQIGGAINLTEEQSSLITIVIFLIIAFFVLKFLKFIIKWVIVILIIWIILQIIGVI